MKDVLGARAWRRKPLRERLLPWPFYALMSVVSLGCGLYLLSSPDGLANTAAVAWMFFLLAPAGLYLTVLSRRVRR